MPDIKYDRPKTIFVFGEEVRLIEPIKCDFCKTPQSPKRRTCEHCGSQYSDSQFNVNDDHPTIDRKLLN
jgi:hypothetical protein